jgi:hypothetical protein
VVTPSVAHKQIDRLEVTTVSIAGTYTGSMLTQAPEPKPDYALLGAIVQGSEGLLFFKLTGPRHTVEMAGNSFQILVDTLKSHAS